MPMTTDRGRIPAALVQRIVRGVDLVEMAKPHLDKARMAGSDLTGCCPFHGEKTPSFRVFSRGEYHCFGCGAHGDALDFLMEIEGVDWLDGLKELANLAGLMDELARHLGSGRAEGQDSAETRILAALAELDTAGRARLLQARDWIGRLLGQDAPAHLRRPDGASIGHGSQVVLERGPRGRVHGALFWGRAGKERIGDVLFGTHDARKALRGRQDGVVVLTGHPAILTALAGRGVPAVCWPGRLPTQADLRAALALPADRVFLPYSNMGKDDLEAVVRTAAAVYEDGCLLVLRRMDDVANLLTMERTTLADISRPGHGGWTLLDGVRRLMDRGDWGAWETVPGVWNRHFLLHGDAQHN